MIITVVGSGTLVPHAKRSTPAFHIQEGDTAVTLDGGSGTLSRQAQLGIDYDAIDWLCFTHVHPDHTLDLLHFLFASTHGNRGLRKRPVRLVGPKGFSRFVDHLREGVRSWTTGGAAGIEVTEVVDQQELALGPLSLKAIELHHSVINMGYRITDPTGRVVAFTGDTGQGPKLLELALKAELLVSECSGLENNPMDGHLTAAQAGRLSAEAQVGQLVLSHLYPLADDRDRLHEASQYYPGPILLSRDGDRFSV